MQTRTAEKVRAAEPQHIANALWAVASVDAVPEVRDLIQRAQMHSLSGNKSFNGSSIKKPHWEQLQRN